MNLPFYSSYEVQTDRSYLAPLIADIGFRAYTNVDPDEYDFQYIEPTDQASIVYYTVPDKVRKTVEEGQKLYDLYKLPSDSSPLEEKLVEQRLWAFRSNVLSLASIKRIFAHQTYFEEYSYHSICSSWDSGSTLSNYVITWLCWGGSAAIEWAMDVLNGSALPTAPTELAPTSIYQFSDYDQSASIHWLQENPIVLESPDGDSKKLKVPVARLGSWKNPIYGEVTFDQDTFDSFIENFTAKITGYEPPLFLGHPMDVDSAEGHPAAGFLEELVQEGDILWAIADDVDDATYDLVRDGRYRYASAEMLTNGTNKDDGSSVGPLLIGLALTNRPFVPNLPRVEALADRMTGNILLSSFNITPTKPQDEVMTTNTNGSAQQPQSPPPAATVTAQPSGTLSTSPTPSGGGGSGDAPSTQQPQQFSNPPVQSSQNNQQIDLTDHVLELARRVELAEKQLREQTKAGFLSRINAMTLSDTTKQHFTSMIQSDGFTPDQMEKVLDGLKTLSDGNEGDILTQKGEHLSLSDSSNETTAESPYAKVLDRNRKLAEQHS